eukprot:UN02124
MVPHHVVNITAQLMININHFLTEEMLQSKQFFGFSEYWFLTRDVLRIEPHDFTTELFEQLSAELCDIHSSKQHWGLIEDRLTNKQFPDSANDQRVRQQCFKGAWMSTMLHEGHKLPTSTVSDR